MMDYNQLFQRGEDYCAAAVLNWDQRRSKIIKHYVETKSFLFPYEQRSRHMRLALQLEAWIDEILLFYRGYHNKRKTEVNMKIDARELCRN